MINTKVFNYVNVLDKAADAAWLRNEAISNNISNVDTPGYKRQEVHFEIELKKALGHNRTKPMDSKVGDINFSKLNPRTYKDYDSFSYRLDGNNVDIEQENVNLAANQIRYNGLMQGINAQFNGLKAVMK